jgi:Flp pilus assembly pilin Flp
VQLFLRRTEKEVGSKIFNAVRNLKEQTQMKTIKNFLKDESGMETLEYAVIAGLIALVAVAIYAVGGAWKGTLQNRLANAASQN